MNDHLSKEDYEEPCCPLELHPETKTIPLNAVIEKLDAYLERREFAAAERHLRYWAQEAQLCRDFRGKLTVLNEQIGFYRKQDKEAECFCAVKEALALSGTPDLAGTVTLGTTLINAATAYKAFGKAEEALPLYVRAREIYESALPPEDARLGGLYNNTALALCDLGSYAEAEKLYQKALAVMLRQTHGEADAAITYLNLADLVTAETGIGSCDERIEQYLQKAEELLNTETLPRDGYYAFVCEKCAPVFGYYGYFLTEKEVKERAEKIYEGN